MKNKSQKYLLALPAVALLAGGNLASAASTLILEESFILTSDNGGGSGSFDVSVESSYQGYYGVADDGGGPPGLVVSDTFFGTVTAYRFWNAVSNTPNTLAQSGGIIGNLTTTDTALTNFTKADIWETTDPNGSAFSTSPDFTGNIGDITDFAGTVDITGVTKGSFYIFYGAYRSTPTLDLIMTGSGTAGDLTVAELHTNGDQANNNEYYVARVDFTNDDGYTSLNYGTLADRNYRFSGIVMTNGIPEPSTALLGALGFLALLRRRR